MNVKGIKIKKVSIALFVLAVACLVLLIPAVQSALIAVAEGTLLKRKLGLPAMWLTAMRLCGIAGIVFFAALIYLIQTEKEALPEELFERHAKTIGVVLTALFSACAVGFCFISADIWVDEAYSYSLLTPSLLQVAPTLAHVDLHPPLYHIIVKALSLIFGSSVPAMKLYSALPAVLFSVIAFRFLSKEFSHKAAAVFELFLLSLGSFFPYCYEIRMYSWAAFFCGLCAIFSFYIIKRGRLSDWVFYVLAAVCSAYTHHFAAVVIMCNFVALCAYKFIKSPAARKYIFIAAALGVVLYSPWIPVLLSKLGQVSDDFWIEPLTPKSILGFLAILSPGRDLLSYLGLLFMAVLLCALVYSMVRTRSGGVWQALCAFSPLAMVFVGVAVSLLVRPLFYSRYAIPGIFMVAFAGALIITDFKRLRFFVCVFLLVFFSVYSFCGNGTLERKISQDYKEFMQTLTSQITDETKFVYVNNKEGGFGGHERGVMAMLFQNHEHYYVENGTWDESLFSSKYFPLEDLRFDSKLCVVASDGDFDEEDKAFVASVLGDENWTDAEYALVTPGQYKKYRVYFFDKTE